MSVDFITFTYAGDIERSHAANNFQEQVDSHRFQFTKHFLIYQRCMDHPLVGKGLPDWMHYDFSERHPDILIENGINPNQPKADEMTHGPTAAHYWKWHVINHLIGAKISTSDWIVFCDADCRMLRQQPESWIERGLALMKVHPQILLVSPGEGGSSAERMLGDVRLTQNVSQQLFLINRQRFLSLDLDIPWDWEYIAPGGPMQEYYYMLEGRLWRYMHKHDLWRAVLPNKWRYWHFQWH